LKNWEAGDPQLAGTIANLYQAWDSDSPTDMASYLADSTVFDWPNGVRVSTNKETVEAVLRKWRNTYSSTTNTPFSLISLHNIDRNQDWVIAWVWNKWQTKDGKKDSMLVCDNWLLKNGKVVYLNSSENRTSKSLSGLLNTAIPVQE
nr:nuclear transport factor 2 family protein [Flavihumibacter sp.]